jgi:hypothetical protein
MEVQSALRKQNFDKRCATQMCNNFAIEDPGENVCVWGGFLWCPVCCNQKYGTVKLGCMAQNAELTVRKFWLIVRQ